jgi:hypothetical protein
VLWGDGVAPASELVPLPVDPPPWEGSLELGAGAGVVD